MLWPSLMHSYRPPPFSSLPSGNPPASVVAHVSLSRLSNDAQSPTVYHLVNLARYGLECGLECVVSQGKAVEGLEEAVGVDQEMV